jgi:hypothetical protein
MKLPEMKAILRHKGYRLYTRPYELNIVGLRSKSVVANRFDDEIHVFYKVSPLKWRYHVFKATTDPGTYWLRQPMQPQGTAILAQGQYNGCWRIGLHKGKYTALVQSKPITIIRDYNRDAVLDFNNGYTVHGLFGIDIHRANISGSTTHVDKNSAGCQVFENAADFALFMSMCEKHSQLYGNAFTYTLIDFRAVRRQNFRYMAYGAGLLGLAGFGYACVRYHQNRQNKNKDNQVFSKPTITPTHNENELQRNHSPDT